MLHDISILRGTIRKAIDGSSLAYCAADVDSLILQAAHSGRPLATFIISGEKDHTITMIGVGLVTKVLEVKHFDQKGLAFEVCGWLSTQLVSRIEQIFQDLSAAGFRKVE